MTTLRTIAALTLGTLIASTSLVSAMPNIVIPVVGGSSGSSGIVSIQIKDPPKKPQIHIYQGKANNNAVSDESAVTPTSRAVGDPRLAVDCAVVDGAPTTDDLWLVNAGASDLPAGLKIRFSVPSTGDHGAFQLNHSIAKGAKVKLAGLLDGAQSGAPCVARVL